jgi:hypothetical protein
MSDLVVYLPFTIFIEFRDKKMEESIREQVEKLAQFRWFGLLSKLASANLVSSS